MSETASAFLRFDGRLTARWVFTRYPGWETDRIAHTPAEGDGEYDLRLLDEAGRILTSASPRVDFGAECRAQSDPASTRVTCYIAFAPAARMLVFARGERVLWRETVAPEPPSVADVRAERVDAGRWRVSWSARHEGGGALSFNVFVFRRDGLGIGVARHLTTAETLVDLGDAPGGSGCRLGVLASDGVRSGIALSEPFDLPEKPPRVIITAPEDGAVLSWLQPESARGNALDVLSRPLPEAGLSWFLDGQPLAVGQRLIALPALEPGPHRLSLRYSDGSGVSVQDDVGFSVAPPSPGLIEWQSRLAAARGR